VHAPDPDAPRTGAPTAAPRAAAPETPAEDAAEREPGAGASPHHEPLDRAVFRRGVRAGIPFSVASGLVALSFGTLAVDVGFPVLAAIVMSAVVFAGSAQFATLTIVAGGGGLGAAVLAAVLVNSRFLPMGVALAPSLPGGPVARALQGQAVIDASWAMAARPDGSFDRSFLFGFTALQYATWVVGTALGAFGGNLLGDTDRFGFDAIFPTFFLVLLITELREGRGRGVAAAGALIALALIPFTPTGVPVLAASAAALVGLRQRGLPDPSDEPGDAS
jgi:4-azaleucine resistance transporter AzlC